MPEEELLPALKLRLEMHVRNLRIVQCHEYDRRMLCSG
jgi:hypothetical protein